ncbi:MAG TPA: exostosin family protein [Kofleriaceae bacterium]|nr:exostosin family protein [Kofleriaceae bacterium]
MSGLFATARDTLARAIDELDASGLPSAQLVAIARELDARSAVGEPDDADAPYFIPNDLAQCTRRSVLNCSHIDRPLDLPAGFSIEASAVRPHAFAKPYYIDPEQGIRRCKGLAAATSYAPRHAWEFDLAFVGDRGKLPDPDLRVETASTRAVFLPLLESFVAQHPALRAWIRIYDGFFFRAARSDEERRQMNETNRYIDSIAHSRFVICPRGGGASSIRFFETLAVTNVPVYVGDRVTRMPLDWLIDWDRAAYRIACEDLLDGAWHQRLADILAVTDDEVNRRRRYIFDVYHQFLAPERKPVFEQLVRVRAYDALHGRTPDLAPA